jgi:site-specific DNA-adenine methylase
MPAGHEDEIAEPKGGHQQAWTQAEDTILLEGLRRGDPVRLLDGKVGTRTYDAVTNRYTYLRGFYGIKVPTRRAPRSYRRWTPEEDAVITEALEEGLTQRAIVKLLPDRNTVQVQNRIRGIRCKANRVCVACSDPHTKDYGHRLCPPCRVKHAATSRLIQSTRKAAGLCVQCGLEPADASLTYCEKCLIKNRSYNPAPKVSRSRNPHQGLLRWIGTPAVSPHVRRFPRGYKVVDLFGGSAAYTLKASTEGLHAMVYNDLHPGLAALVASVKAGNGTRLVNLCRDLAKKPVDELVGLYQRGTSLHQEGLAAVTLMLARAAEGKNLRNLNIERVYAPPEALKDRFARAARELQRTEVTNLDFAEAIDRFDAPDTFFFVDPPYIGTAKFEHNLTSRHGELAEKLMGIQGRFLLVSHSSRASARMIRPMPFVYRADAFLGPLRIREFIATNYPLSGKDEESMDWSAFGL